MEVISLQEKEDFMSNYPLRLDPKLMEKIKKLAIYEGRSMNKEIEYILKNEINKLEKNNPTLFKQFY